MMSSSSRASPVASREAFDSSRGQARVPKPIPAGLNPLDESSAFNFAWKEPSAPPHLPDVPPFADPAAQTPAGSVGSLGSNPVAALPGYNTPFYIQGMDAAQISYIRAFESGNTILGPTHSMMVKKLILIVKFPSIILSPRGSAEGLTLDVIYAQMRSHFSNLFNIEDT
jgi:hypothetical protein